MRLGISSYTFGWAVEVPGHEPLQPLDEHGLVEKCGIHRVKLLQIGDNLPLHPFDAARMERLRRRADDEGVQLEIGARRLTTERIADYAAIARRLNAKLIRFVTDDSDYHPKPDTVTAVLREATSFLDGLSLGIENHDRFRAATLRNVIESVGDDRIGICLDTANSLGAGEGIDEVFATLAPLVINLHVKDFQIRRVQYLMGFNVTGCPAGEGLLDIPSLLDRLVPFNKCKTAVLELWTPPEPDIQQTIAKEAAWAAQSIEFLKPLFEP